MREKGKGEGGGGGEREGENQKYFHSNFTLSIFLNINKKILSLCVPYAFCQRVLI